jgi:hypothetical protein
MGRYPQVQSTRLHCFRCMTEYFFDNVKKIVDTIKEIDDGNRVLDPNGWRLLRNEYR